MAKRIGGVTTSVSAKGVTFTNKYDGSKQFIPKDEWERRMSLTDKENEKEINSQKG